MSDSRANSSFIIADAPVDDAVERATRLANIEEGLNTCRTEQESQYTALTEEESRDWRRVRIDGARAMRAAKEAEFVRVQREEKQEFLTDRNEVIDHWAPIKSARSGAITFRVVRAENVGGFFAGAMLHTNPYVVVSYGTHIEVESEVVRDDECPEFDFESYFAVEDDTQPILVTVMEKTISSRFGVGMVVGSTSVDLRREYANLAKSAPDGVYTEKCSVIQPLYGNGSKLGDMRVTIEWTLRLRDTNKVVFCDECGRLDVRCTCTPEEKQARRDAIAAEQRRRQLEELAARNLRVTQEEETSRRFRLVDEAQFGLNTIARNGNVDLAQIRAAIRRKRLAERKGGAGANVTAEVEAKEDQVVDEGMDKACADAGMPPKEYDPVDLYARTDTNLRGVPDAVIVEDSKPKEESGGCCIVA